MTDGEGKSTGGGGGGATETSLIGSCGFKCAGQSEVDPDEGVMVTVRCRLPLTVVKVDDGGVPGHAGVKVRHQRGNVLRGCEHPMDHVTRVDEPWRGREGGRDGRKEGRQRKDRNTT